MSDDVNYTNVEALHADLCAEFKWAARAAMSQGVPIETLGTALDEAYQEYSHGG